MVNVSLSVFFYRPPNANQEVLQNIDRSIDLAIDTNIDNIIVTGDFNLNFLAENTKRKLDSLFLPYGLQQVISEPTHFTETSHSLIDVMYVSKPRCVVLSGVGEPFLDMSVRYHCPIFSIFDYNKPKTCTYSRRVWKYSEGNYNLLRIKYMRLTGPS